MLRRGEDLVVGQPAHAWVSGQLARAWGNAAFPAPAPREPFCLAAEQHDVGWADADLEPWRLFDSFPLPLCACYRLRQSTLPISGATFGRAANKKLFFHGLRPQLLITASGFIDDLVLCPGNCNDTPALAFYLDECVELGRSLAGQTRVADNGYSKPTQIPRAK